MGSAIRLSSASGEVIEVVGTHVDVTERKRAEEERDRLRQLEADLAHINRVSMMGELAASISHELKQPITGAITSANAALRWLKRDQPDVERACETTTRIIKDGTRAAEIIDRLRSLYAKSAPLQELVDVNGIPPRIWSCCCGTRPTGMESRYARILLPTFRKSRPTVCNCSKCS